MPASTASRRAIGFSPDKPAGYLDTEHMLGRGREEEGGCAPVDRRAMQSIYAPVSYDTWWVACSDVHNLHATARIGLRKQKLRVEHFFQRRMHPAQDAAARSKNRQPAVFGDLRASHVGGANRKKRD